MKTPDWINKLEDLMQEAKVEEASIKEELFKEILKKSKRSSH